MSECQIIFLIKLLKTNIKYLTKSKVTSCKFIFLLNREQKTFFYFGGTWKAGKCTQASYNTAKRISRRVMHHARHEADKVVYEGIDHKSDEEREC